ncbi:OmpA family protein [Pseudotabrizicola algicola]|uniref:OmpA family protein n=1 Tax=Pseudotabrizicola algicola TaxID=2709381 RepID=A0A6B3RQW4_9RHOB|nr:OmpA family protein [Pseudotabrizicola algicola]NEX47663.1 OmpA family protein [Pseudotabrizicola algicola]
MTFKTPLLLSAASLLALTACVDPNAFPDNPNARAQQGAILGGLVGAAAGASSGEDRLGRAVLGGAVGAIAGGAIGATLDRQAAELRGSINNPNVTVTNNGQFLVVNLPQDLLFAVDSTALRPDLRADLASVAQSLIRYPNSRIEVIGHTDNTGSAAYNYDLSQRRAVAVSNVLTQNGVPFSRITNIGRGFDQPVASNATPQGRAQNRRVEIIIRPTQ